MDPQLTSDGKPYGPAHYKELVKQLYFISSNIHTSYEELKNITPTEREYLISFIADNAKKQKEQWEKNLEKKN